MGVVICLPLFGPPGRELEDEAAVEGRRLRQLAEELNDRLRRAADTLDRLTANGWTARVAMYDLILAQPGVETQEEAARRLQALGVAPEELLIVEDVDDEDVGHAWGRPT
jgi:hypothetical protein